MCGGEGAIAYFEAELENPKSGIILEMSRTNSHYDNEVGGYTEDEDKDFRGDTVANSPKVEDRGNLCWSHGKGAGGS